MSESDPNSIELLLKNILGIVNKLEREVADNDDQTRQEIVVLKQDIKKLEELFEHEEIMQTLSHNVSPEGLKELLDDVNKNTDFRKKYQEKCDLLAVKVEKNSDHRKESVQGRKVMEGVWKFIWMLGVPVIIFTSGIIWWFTKEFFNMREAIEVINKAMGG